MRLVARSLHLWVGVTLFVAFWISASLIPNPIMLLLSNSFMLCASLAVGVAYIPIAWRAVRLGRSRRATAIALGICYSWCFGSLWRVISLFWLTSGQNMVLVNNDITSMCQSGIGLGALLHLTTIDDPAAGRPALHWTLIGGVIAASLALAATLAIVHPDTRWLATLITPYIPK